MFRMAIVDECGEVKAWMTDLTGAEIVEMLDQHPEWQMRSIEL